MVAMVVDFEKVLHFHSASLAGLSGYRTVLIERSGARGRRSFTRNSLPASASRKEPASASCGMRPWENSRLGTARSRS